MLKDTLKELRSIPKGIRYGWKRLWVQVRRAFPAPPQVLQKLLLWLLVISALAGAGSYVVQMMGLEQTEETSTAAADAVHAEDRLKAIAGWLDATRDWLTADAGLKAALADHGTAPLFTILNDRANDFARKIPDSIKALPSSQYRPGASESYAIYSVDGKLLAWRSPVEATFGIDTALTGAMLLPNRDRALLLENGPIYAYLIAIRKLVATDGRTEAYVVTKQELATKVPLGNSLPSNFLDDLPGHLRRGIFITFGGRPDSVRSDVRWERKKLYADPADPTSFTGVLSISRKQQAEASIGYEFLHAIWSFGVAIVLFLAMLWFLYAIAEGTPEPKTVGARIVYSFLALLALFAVRIIIAELGTVPMLVGPAFLHGSEFSSNWIFGIAKDPTELFITSVFATAMAVMLWIVWMPRERLVRDTSRDRGSSEPTSYAGLYFLLGIGSIVLWELLLDGLSAVAGTIVNDGSLRYLSIGEVLPEPGSLMMLLSFLGIGVAYLFLAVLVLTAALRAFIGAISTHLLLWSRIVIGSMVSLALLAGSVVLFDQASLSDTSMWIRSALAALTFLVSVAVIVVDSIVTNPTADGPSFLYKLPRSSRSILFILAVSALIMSPLVADKQLLNDEDAARRIVLQNANVDTPVLEQSAEGLLNFARTNLDEWRAQGHDTTSLHDRAFMIWFEGMREHPIWNASIDIYNAGGQLESHFATLGVTGEINRMRPSLDSELIRLRERSDGDSSTNKWHILNSFTSSGTPAIVGGTRVMDTSHAGTVPSALSVTVVLWNELPSLANARSRISILPGGSPAVSRIASREFVIAEYRPNMRRLTNSPALDVPSSVPPVVERKLERVRTVWSPTVLHGEHYQTLYYRAPTAPTLASVPAIFAVSVPEPSFSRTLEFALRLNAVGLLYGVLIVVTLLIVRQIALRRMHFTLHFRDRIFLIVLVIALVPLVVVTNVTRNLLAERAQVEEQDRLARDATAIKDRMMKTIEPSAPAVSGASLQTEVDYLSEVIGRDFSVFDGAGRLRASSRPELYESSLLSTTINSAALQDVLVGERSFFTGNVNIGTQNYTVGYEPVTSSDGSRVLAILSLATMDEQPRIEAEIARTTSFIYGTFAALGLILLAIGALFAARVALPIMELIRATERVGQGKLTTRVPVTREDEIGDLMRAFNTMTHELERSREIVAQTERELAWKEMARQVAHEIKNPLTPMKLSVQHLEYAHEAKDPNFNPIFRRVIRTLHEQIDVLTRIATEFAHFGAMPRRRWGAVDIRKVGDSAVALFDAERNRIRFIVDVPKKLPRVHSDEEELRRAFVNLIRNSIQAIEGWGVIVIRARAAQGMVNISIHDTGFGMADETL
ncbi:MAG TPA: HAMP domain-containing protein, partial [Candidatus Kapabacteria bacterium]